MRLEGKSKLGYYPTPAATLTRLITWLGMSNTGFRRYFDPCCGEGEALAAIAKVHPAETVGVELSDVRATIAAEVLNKVLNTSYESIHTSPGAYSLCLLNPPYDGEGMTGGGKRMEETFLIDQDTTGKLTPGGILIYIIPHSRINERIARHLAGWYDNLCCFKVAEDEYDIFKQAIILGIRREHYVTPDKVKMSPILAWADGNQIASYEEIEVEVEKASAEGGIKRVKVKEFHPVFAPLDFLQEGLGEFQVPICPEDPFRFQYTPFTSEELYREAAGATSRLNISGRWLSFRPKLEPAVYRPAMSPKRGHISQQLLGGLLGTNTVHKPDGTLLMLKGQINKISNTKILDDDDLPSDPDKEKMTRVEVVESFQTIITTLDNEGDLQTLVKVEEIGALLDQYVEQLAEILQMRNKPRYDFHPQPWEWDVFNTLSRGRLLPGRSETGLTDTQKHLAIALGRLLLEVGAGFINAEMGSGKAQPLHAKLLTPNGWTTMQNICIGDQVIGADGKPTKVVGVFPQGKKKIYRVTFTDGSWAECCEDHLWTVQTPLNKWKGKSPKTMSLKDIIEKGLAHTNGNLQHFIPLVEPVELARQEQPLDAYLLGVLLGDGGLSHSCPIISSADEEILNGISQVLPPGLALRRKGHSYDYFISSGVKGYSINQVTSDLRALGLIGCRSEAKFIPQAYQFGSVEQRTSLLQGLLDTDGYVRPGSCTIEYITVSERLADDVTFIVQSLGGTVTRRIKEAPGYKYNGEQRKGQKAYRLFIALPNIIQPFRLSRKIADYLPRTKYQPSRAIQSIEFVGGKDAQCIKVEAENGLYVTDNCVVTHNTTISIAIAEYLKVAMERKNTKGSPYPTMVVGPGIVTGKENWPKEIPEVTPGATSKVVTIGVKPVAKTLKLGQWLKLMGLIIEDWRFSGLDPKTGLSLIMRAAYEQGINLDNWVNAIRYTLQQAEKHPPIRRKRESCPNPLDRRIGGFLWTGMDLPRDEENRLEINGKYSLPQFITDYKSGRLPAKSYAVLSFETGKLGAGRVPAMNTRAVRVKIETETPYGGRQIVKSIKTYCTCPHCGSLVAEKYDEESGSAIDPIEPEKAEEFVGLRRRFCQAPKKFKIYNPFKGIYEVRAYGPDGVKVCGAPLFEETSLRRVSAAEYVKSKAKNTFGLLIVDEVHQAKAKGTGVGWTLQVLSQACKFTLGASGTLFGGYSTSVFMLWYRLIRDVRKEFSFKDEEAWVRQFGLLKQVFYLSGNAETQEDGAFTGTKFHETVSERPGVSPAIMRFGLPFCTFSSLKDIGLPLPEYSEEIVRIPLTKEMDEQMRLADGSGEKAGLFSWALTRQKEDDGRGAISVWLNTALNRPDASFRGEVVAFNPRQSGRGRFARRSHEVVMTLPSVIDEGKPLPKEEWLINTCLAERALGRKILVYVRQTGERDIQERLTQLLRNAGLRTQILKPSIKPEKRASWIKAHAAEMDVLITNAKLVQVGLNLTNFNTGIFFECEWSLFVIWQALRRLFRPGAYKAVKMLFPVYQGTLEESMINLIGQKMRAAALFYGDEATGALVEEEEGDLLSALVQVAMGKIQIGQADSLFNITPTTSESAMGSPIVVSPILAPIVWGEDLQGWMAARGITTVTTIRRKSSKQAFLVTEGQLSLL